MHAYQHILLRKEPPLGWITFNRPDKRNSMIPEMGDELVRAAGELDGDPDIRAVVVTGAGKAFSAGGDLDMIRELSKVERAESHRFMADYYRKYFVLRQLAVPTIAMINGSAIGAGLCVALACDLRTIAASAKIGLTFVRVGLNVGMGGTYTLPHLIGLGRAAELLLTGDVISADQALDWGLVSRVCSPAKLEAETSKLARKVAGHAPAALRYTKRSLYEGLGRDLDFVFENEADGQSHCYQTEDILEGVSAVRQKRRPDFQGK